MTTARLQIKLLSSSGELLNVVTAPGGRLTVLRAFVPSQLEPYRRAIAGIPGPERITITINGDEFIPDDHILIGFGENARSGSETVSQHLANNGLNPNTIPGLLMSYGLTEIASLPFARLTDCQVQRCRLLAALQQTDRLIILNNPFEPLSSEWREPFAQLLLTFVRSSPMPVLVTSMSYRPECFINNELINRVQVGENDQRTIGFGSEPSEYDRLIQQIRADQPAGKKNSPGNSEAIRKKKSAPQQSSAAKKSSRDIPVENRSAKRTRQSKSSAYGVGRLLRHKTIRKGIGICVGGALLLALALHLKESGTKTSDQIAGTSKKPEQTKLALKPEPATPKKPPQQLQLKQATDSELPPGLAALQNAQKNNKPAEPEVPSVKKAPPKPAPVKVAEKQKKPAEPKNIYMLDMYRTSLKASILSSFEGTESARAANMQLSGVGVQAKGDSTGELSREKQADAFTRSLLTDLKKTDGSGEHLPDRQSPTIRSSSSSPFNSSPRPASNVNSNTNSDFKDMSKEERRALLREKFRLAIERAAQNK